MDLDCAGEQGNREVLFDYAPICSGSVPTPLLDDVSDHIVTDDYKEYNAVCEKMASRVLLTGLSHTENLMMY